MDLTRVFDSAHALHAASVHMPLSLGLLGLPLAIAAFLAPKRWPGVRLFGAAFFLLTCLAAGTAVYTGQRAASELVALANKDIETVVAHHRLLGWSVAVLAFVSCALLTVSHFRARSGGRASAGFATLSALALTVVLLYAGSSGGRLVYGWGIGTSVADGTSGATRIVGGKPADTMPVIPPALASVAAPADSTYTPNVLPIDPAQAASITFTKDIVPLLERHCLKCHGGQSPEAGLNLSTHAGILKGGDYAGPAVVPGAPDSSPMVLHIRGVYLPKMPKDAAELTESELHVIRVWIAAGAKDEQ
ncbi:MAG: hypothetical protein IT364_21000 [Candidatus Hydrogenedentes bacterium]|nr:hypothetical protein [Candidatus Hydrogenedentota bacterium]